MLVRKASSCRSMLLASPHAWDDLPVFVEWSELGELSARLAQCFELTCRVCLKVNVRPTAPSHMLSAVVRFLASLKGGSDGRDVRDRIAAAEEAYRETAGDEGEDQMTWGGALVAEPGYDADDGVHR